MLTSPRPRRLTLAAVATTLLLLGACSAGGSNDATTTTTVEKPTTTVEADRTTTTEADGRSDGPTSDDLAALLPTAADIGSGYRPEPADDKGDDPSSTDDELDRQCPEVAALNDDTDDDSDDVEAGFSNADNQRVSVKLNPTAEKFSEAKLDQLIDATNACSGSFEDPDNGTTTEFSFDVSRTDAFGDQGVQIESVLTISGDKIPKPVTITVYILNYRVGTVGVEVSGQDGVDNSTFEPIALDPDLLITLGRDLETKVQDLVDG